MSKSPLFGAGFFFKMIQNHGYLISTKTASVSLTLAGLIAVVPFLLPHHGLATAFYSEWVAFALGCAACFPFLSRSFWTPLAIPHSALWLLAMIVLIALQAPFVGHAYTTQALLPGTYLTWAMVLVILSAWIRKQLGIERSIATFAWLLLIGGTLSTAVGLVQYFGVPDALTFIIDPSSAAIFGNIGQRNHFAAYIALTSFALVYLYAIDRIPRSLALVLMTGFAFALTASGSRAAAAYVIAGFLLSLISHRAARTPIHRRLLHGTGLLLILFFGFQYFMPLLNGWLKLFLGTMGFHAGGLDSLAMLQRDPSQGIDLRLSEWHKSWLMFLESPFWGIGIDNYAWHSFNDQALPEFSAIQENVLFQHSHNLFTQILAELGATGLLLLVFMGATWLYRMLPHRNAPSYWLILALGSVIFLHSNVEYPLWYSYFLGIAAVLLGLGSEGMLKIKFSPSLGQLVSGITLIFSGAMLFITLQGFQDIAHVDRLVATTSPRQAAATLQAISKNPFLTPWAESAMAMYGAPKKNTIDQQLLLTTRVMRYRPNPTNVYRQVMYLALAGKSTEASVLMKKAFIIYPLDFPKFACSWKFAPAIEVQRLWEEARTFTGDKIDCETALKTPVNPS